MTASGNKMQASLVDLTYIQGRVRDVCSQPNVLTAPLGAPVCLPKCALICVRAVGYSGFRSSSTEECGIANEASACVAFDSWQSNKPDDTTTAVVGKPDL